MICEEDLFKSMCYLVLREVDCVSEGVEALPAIVLPQSVLVWSLVIILVILKLLVIILIIFCWSSLVIFLTILCWFWSSTIMITKIIWSFQTFPQVSCVWIMSSISSLWKVTSSWNYSNKATFRKRPLFSRVTHCSFGLWANRCFKAIWSRMTGEFEETLPW